jgi:cyclic pyranopterin phosphate synthase
LKPNELTHIAAHGNAFMVDVGTKQKTARQAVASGRIVMSAECYQAMVRGQSKKGDVLGVARVAGIMAAKKTPELIPLCHGIPLNSVEIHISADEEKGLIEVAASAVTEGKTGIEMEAIVAVSGTCLCIYDMCKAVDKDMVIGNIRLIHKSGGRSGDYNRKL